MTPLNPQILCSGMGQPWERNFGQTAELAISSAPNRMPLFWQSGSWERTGLPESEKSTGKPTWMWLLYPNKDPHGSCHRDAPDRASPKLSFLAFRFSLSICQDSCTPTQATRSRLTISMTVFLLNPSRWLTSRYDWPSATSLSTLGA